MPIPKISASKIPLEGWIANIWVETLKRWYPMSGSPIFKTPEAAMWWGSEELKGWPPEK